MEGKFFVYPDKCLAECDALDGIAQSVNSSRNQLEQVKNALLYLRGSGYGDVARTLERIMEEVGTEQKNIENLKSVLEQSMNNYLQTEARIAGKTVNNQVDAKESGETEEKSSIGDWIAKILESIDEFRGLTVVSFLESIMLDGLLDENVLKDLKKILSGTYLTSYWKNGIEYFKLHCSDMTNREAAKWLEETLGGKWDDYVTRNLKRNGFGVFDIKDGVLKDMKYFENITDADLIKYIDNLKGLEKLDLKSFASIFKNEFKLLDDFNYKDFKSLGKLGKAGKVLGTAGTVLTLGADVCDNFYDEDTETWKFSGERLVNCAWDGLVDLTAGASSAAAGAAVGSLFAPPVGTVVGAGVGIGIDLICNNIGILDVDGNGEKDSAVDIVKHWGDELVDGVTGTWDNIADNAGDWLESAFAF